MLSVPPAVRLQTHYVQHKVFVGLESEPGFDVKDKLLGPGGSFLHHITAQTGARMQLRGRGSGYLEPTSGREAFEQLYIHVRYGAPGSIHIQQMFCTTYPNLTTDS
jgi:hypothetical protein